LGIYIGSEKFISAKLETVMSALEQQADEIMAYATGNGHRAFYLLKKSYSKKICDHQRMTNPSTIGPFNVRFSNLIRKMVDHISGFEISDVTWLQMRLKKKHRGCDLGIQEDIAWASFVSSFEENIGSVVQLLPDIFPIGEVGLMLAIWLLRSAGSPTCRIITPARGWTFPPLTSTTLSLTWSCNLPLHFTPVRGSLFSQVAATASPRT
jgi:hypothetical protein